MRLQAAMDWELEEQFDQLDPKIPAKSNNAGLLMITPSAYACRPADRILLLKDYQISQSGNARGPLDWQGEKRYSRAINQDPPTTNQISHGKD